MSQFNYTTVDRVLSGLLRELRGTDLNESDLIEWIGEALGFLEMPEIQEQAVAFLKVKNHQAPVPKGLHLVLQLAKYDKEEKECCNNEIEIEDFEIPDINDCEPIIDTLCCEMACSSDIRPYFDMQWQYIPWTASHYYHQHFSPIRLATNTFFNSIVCKEKNLYEGCEDEYTLVGDLEKQFRFSFKEGFVALSYLRTALDDETGYPLIPDSIQHITAIRYYVRWKISEFLDWQGREGFANKTQYNMQLWLKYVKQATNYTKMPKTIDEYQNLLEQTHYLIPRHDRYYKFFGKLGKSDYLNGRL